MEVLKLGTTTVYNNPSWNGGGFAEAPPQRLWRRLPESLRKIALEELQRGNEIAHILENRERDIVLLKFKKVPFTRREGDASMRVHTSHAYGNYCYDGTKATYEDIESGCFLSFVDPDWSSDENPSRG